jgi:hypothetical protein
MNSLLSSNQRDFCQRRKCSVSRTSAAKTFLVYTKKSTGLFLKRNWNGSRRATRRQLTKIHSLSSRDPRCVQMVGAVTHSAVFDGSIFLGRYAALYANEVTMPMPLVAPEQLRGVKDARDRLSRTSSAILQLRPVITRGIIKPVVMVTRHCVHTIEWMRQIDALVYGIADAAVRGYAGKFTAEYQHPGMSPTGQPTVYLAGPKSFVDHGAMVVLYKRVPKWIARTWKYDAEGKTRLPSRKTIQFVQYIFKKIAEDTTFYLAYGLLHRARLLTDLPGEGFLLDWLTGDDRIGASATAMQSLTHVVPILAELPLATLVRIRREERDSFESYRQAITGITQDVLGRNRRLSKKEAQDLLKSVVEPELVRLRKEIRYERKRQAKRIVGGLATLAAGIAIGAFGGLPTLVQAAAVGASAVTGGGLLRKVAEVACEHGSNLRQGNDFYFLARLQQEAEG